MTKTFKQIREIDVPKGHEYGPSSRKRPAGKAGYTSSDSARTTHLKSVKRDAKKKRRQGDKEFANESKIGGMLGLKIRKAIEIAKKMAGNYTGATKEIEKLRKDLSKHPEVADALRLANEEAPANATGTAVAGTGDDSSTVVVKKKKEQQSKLMKRITDSIDKAIPDIKKEEDEITIRKNQLKKLALKNMPTMKGSPLKTVKKIHNKIKARHSIMGMPSTQYKGLAFIHKVPNYTKA